MPTGHLHMNRITSRTCRIVVLLLTTLLIGYGEKAYPPVEILYSYFGRLETNADKTTGVVRTNVIPLREGQIYVWCIEFRTNKEQVRFTEQLTLAAATTWNIKANFDYEVSPDKKTIILKREQALNKGRICGNWGVSADDPPGKAFIKVTIEGKVEHLFDFEFKKP